MKNVAYFAVLALTLSSCKLGRFVVYNFADITDHKIFPSHPIGKDSKNVFQYAKSSKPPLSIKMKEGSKFNTFEGYLEANKTVSFLVIHNDTLKYEKYFNGYQRGSTVASFSMAKSFTSFLIGCALEDGLIAAVEDPITKYIPELAPEFENVSLESVLQMTSGLDFNESYVNPFGHAATFYYGQNLKKATLKLKLKRAPDTQTDYVSGNTQLLGLVLDRVLEGKTISNYLEEKLWSQVGMEYDASWSTDKKKDGIEKTFCCINATAIDFSKFGRLYLKQGNWEGKQLISPAWVETSTKLDTLNGSDLNYQYQWWIPNRTGDFMAEGILGQFIFVSPAENLIIVRLGEKYGEVNWIGTFEKIKELVNRS